MELLVKKYNYENLCKLLIGKKAKFLSDCEFFPNFKVIGRVLEINIANNGEYLIKIRTNTNKIIDIGSNMYNLRFVILF